MKQSKFLSLLLVLVMMFTVQIPVCAVDTPAKLTAKQSEDAERNGALEIHLEASEAVLGGSFNLVYDPSVMTFNYVYSGSYTYQVNSSYATNKVRITFASSSGISSGLLLSFYFTPLVSDSCTTAFSFEDVNLYNEEGKTIDAVAEGTLYEVTVIKEITDVQLSAEELVLGVGEQTQISYLLTPEDAVVDQVNWLSFNPGIATVDANGVITGVREGSTTVRCTVWDANYRSHQRSLTVTVYQKPNVIIPGGYVAAGERITLAIRMDTLGAVYTSGSMNFTYDPTVLSLESAQAGRLLDGCMTTVNPAYAEDTVRLNFLGQAGVRGSGEICVLTFIALQAGEAQIDAEQVLLYKENSDMEYDANIGGGTVGVGEYTLAVTKPAEALARKEFTAAIAFSAAPGVAGGSFVVSYDAEQFRFLGYSGVLTGFAVTVNKDYAPGQIRISFAGTQGVVEGELLKLRFVSKENPEEGVATEIGLVENSVSLYTQSGTRIVAATSNAAFTVAYNESPVEVGDADSNGSTDTRDATLLLRYISGSSDAELDDSLADLNGDGQVNDADMAYLMKLLAGWDPAEIT